MKNKTATTSGPKRRSYDAIDFLAKQPKKSKKRMEAPHYNLYATNLNYEPNDISNKSPKITEEMIPFDVALNNNNIADLKKIFYEMPLIKLPPGTKKTINGHPVNENSYNSIEHLMSSYGYFSSL